MELKETLLMPKTDFPMRGNLPNREPQIEQKWYDENVYQRVLDKNKDKILNIEYKIDEEIALELDGKEIDIKDAIKNIDIKELEI